MKNVALVMLCQDNRFLLAQRALDDKYGGLWTFPGGERDSADKTIICTAFRELYEEVGIKGQRFRLLYNIQIQQYNFNIFFCDKWTSEPVPDNKEIIGIGWFTLSEMYAIEKSLTPIINSSLANLSYLIQHYDNHPKEWTEQWREYDDDDDV